MWVLLVYINLSHGIGGAAVTAEFANKQACIKARDWYTKKDAGIKAECIYDAESNY